MRISELHALALLASVGLANLAAGCGSSDGDKPTSLTVAVAPLQLVGISDAEYHLRVSDAHGNIVWDAPQLLSSRYGDGHGALTYIGPCDASADANPHTVSLWIDGLTDSNGKHLESPGDWRNPTREPSDGDPGVAIERANIVCAENADVRVDFDVTVMRAAEQGFFDVAVNFEDIFCSAKLDCLSEMLHDPSQAGSPRGPTVVLGFACTSGSAAGEPEATHMYLSDLTLRCDRPGDPSASFETRLPVGDITLDGNQGAVARGVFEWARYADEEAFQGIDKCFWNFAVGLDTSNLEGFDCDLVANGTASSKPLVDDLLPTEAVTPYLSWNVKVLGRDGALCGPNPLDGADSGVTSAYQLPNVDTELAPFAAHYLCGGQVATGSLACGAGDTPALQVVQPDPSSTQIVVTSGGASSTYQLSEGWSLGTDCARER